MEEREDIKFYEPQSRKSSSSAICLSDTSHAIQQLINLSLSVLLSSLDITVHEAVIWYVPNRLKP